MSHDPVNSPDHYRWHPVAECIDIVEHFPHLEATAITYLWRAGRKADRLEDLRKARWYIDRAIALEERRLAATMPFAGAEKPAEGHSRQKQGCISPDDLAALYGEKNHSHTNEPDGAKSYTLAVAAKRERAVRCGMLPARDDRERRQRAEGPRDWSDLDCVREGGDAG